ncbi:uncharacterized protein LOC115885100 [Sitophilus oryzae]|uniref:Uncharacterized protein LOC115885100 n=1 Tax=Sitophilus oryzae TaxID=7048 RepID=A0A6J2Y844_SITOR|nr:uncharacterized protein LOC115885100 [Sitophilus oryzae]
MCAPPVCFKEVEVKKRFGLLKFLGFGMKSAVAAALVYISYDMGIWGTTDETQEMYNTACAMFKGPRPKKNTKWDPPSCEAESDLFHQSSYDPYGHCDLPPFRAEDISLKFQRLWNGAISNIFSGIAHFPKNVIDKLGAGSSSAKGAAEDETKKSPVCVSYNSLDPEEKEKVMPKYK